MTLWLTKLHVHQFTTIGFPVNPNTIDNTNFEKQNAKQMSICFLCHFVSILNFIFLNSIGALCFVMLSHLMPCHAMPCHAMPCHAMCAPHLLAHVGPLSEASFFASSAWHRQCNGTPWHEGHSDRGKEQTDSTSGPQTYIYFYIYVTTTQSNNIRPCYIYIFYLYICKYIYIYMYMILFIFTCLVV